MNYRKFSIMFMSVSIIGCTLFTSSACKALETQNTAPEIAILSALSTEKQTTTKEHLTALEKIINVIDRAKFDMFKTHLENGLKHTAKIIPELKQKKETLPSSVNQDVMTIEKTLPKIKAAKTPEELIKKESTAFNAAINALKTINSTNKNAQTKSNVATKLASAEKMTQSLTSTNYKVETKKIFRAIHYSMKEIHRSLKSK